MSVRVRKTAMVVWVFRGLTKPSGDARACRLDNILKLIGLIKHLTWLSLWPLALRVVQEAKDQT